MDIHRLKITLVDPNEALCDCFDTQFGEYENVTVHRGRFEDLDTYDCMVSAANSFGLMDGGVDFAITKFFGLELMDRVQQAILSEFRGEQPVGTSIIVETYHPKHPYLAHTPTMRVPMRISTTDNVYNAMWAMLLAVWRFNLEHDNPIKHIACPGLGTACGGVEPREAARQMQRAYSHFLFPPDAINWPMVQMRQQAIGRGGDPP